MKDTPSINSELIEELSALKERIRELEQSESDREEAEAALKESEERYHVAIEASNDGVAIVQNGVHAYVNQAFLKMFKYKALNEIVGKQIYCIVHPNDHERVLNYATARQKGKYAPTRYGFKGIRKDETPIDIEASVNTISYRGAKAMLVCLRDVTDRKRMEEAIQYQNLLFSTQQEASIDGILVVDEQGAVLSYNRRFVEIWGIPLEVLKTRADEQFLQEVISRLAKPEEFLRKVKYLYEHKQEVSRDEVALADGRVLDRYSAAVVGDEGKYYGRVWYFRDVTEQKQILDALEQRERELMVKSKTLEEVNVALKVLLEQREKDKKEQEDKILFNVRKLILPYIDSLRQRRLDNEQTTYLDIIEANLKNIISPFANRLVSIQESFTPLEVRVADFIRDGKTAKEIARTFGVSESAINLHRQHIRNKLGLNNKKINLRTYLLSLIN